MKAYKITDIKGYCCFATIVFAETRNQAKYIAIHTDSFHDYEYTEIRAVRIPKLDKYYRGLSEMDWENDQDRIAMVKDGNFTCSDEYFEEDDCDDCPAKQWCDRYEVAE